MVLWLPADLHPVLQIDAALDGGQVVETRVLEQPQLLHTAALDPLQLFLDTLGCFQVPLHTVFDRLLRWLDSDERLPPGRRDEVPIRSQPVLPLKLRLSIQDRGLAIGREDQKGQGC